MNILKRNSTIFVSEPSLTANELEVSKHTLFRKRILILKRYSVILYKNYLFYEIKLKFQILFPSERGFN